MDELKSEIVDKIKQAFSNEIFIEIELFVPTAGQYFDTEKVEAILISRTWQSITVDEMFLIRIHITFLTPQAFHYFFPAFLIACIEYPSEVDTLIDSIIHSLNPSDNATPYSKIRFNQIADLYTPQQVEAIVAFLDSYYLLYPDNKWSHSNNDWKQIIEAENFWKMRLNNS